jgi:hypothetical protein
MVTPGWKELGHADEGEAATRRQPERQNRALFPGPLFHHGRRAHGGDPHHLGGPASRTKISQGVLDMRARNIKPGFFKNEDLAETGPYGQILFAGLWGLADREGKLEDRPKRIKAEIFPYYDPNPVVDELLDFLEQRGLILRYSVNGHNYLKIINFLKHQSPHHNEAESKIPDPLSSLEERTSDHGEKSFQPKGEALRPDSLNPDSPNPETLNPDFLTKERSAKPTESKKKKDAHVVEPAELLKLWNEMKPIPALSLSR